MGTNNGASEKPKRRNKPQLKQVDNPSDDLPTEYWSKRLKLLMGLLPPDDWHFKQADTKAIDLATPDSGSDPDVSNPPISPNQPERKV